VAKPRSILCWAGNDKSSHSAKKERCTPKFPTNSKNQIPPEYYKQVKDWYQHAAVPEEKWNKEENDCVSAFSFKHNEVKEADPRHKKWQDKKPYSKPYQSHRSRLSRSHSFD